MASAILVVPRSVTRGLRSFTPWRKAQSFLDEAEQAATWVPREIAEHSRELVQPIPSAMVADLHGKLLLLRRIKAKRADMSNKLSLVVGGHIDLGDVPLASQSLDELSVSCLRRELREELRLTTVDELSGFGIACDSSSVRASRHVGLIYVARGKPRIKIVDEDEFAAGSALTGSFVSREQIERLRNVLDPWSQILLNEALAPDAQRATASRDPKGGAATHRRY